jgi:hypothetical protein
MVSQAATRAFFKSPEFGIIFGEPQERRGVSPITGTVPDKLVALDLVGPPEALTQVTLMVGVASTDPLAPPADPRALADNARYLRPVLQRIMPDWKDGGAWLNTEWQHRAERYEVKLKRGARDIVLVTVNHGTMVLLDIRVSQPAPKRGQ